MSKRKQTGPAFPARPEHKSGEKPDRRQHRGHKHDSKHRAGSGPDPWLYGFHAVLGALANKARKLERLLITRETEAELAREGMSLGHDLALSPEILTNEEIARLLPQGAVHQGIALKSAALPDLLLDEAVEDANLVVVLDQVTDPHNLGAILRSCAVFGAGALIMTERHSPPMTGVVAKAASGALEHVRVAKITNLVRALEELKELGFEVIGLDGEGEQVLTDAKLGSKVALVLGAEGAGLRRLTREHCDWLARLPASGPMKSLNVSNAAAVALYEVAKRG
jgi:23S rRNA (guanosine2251-2'-O)-methyltransferase